MKPLKIHDLNGGEITVTDLNEAIAQASLYKGYRHKKASPAQSAGDDERQRYWEDMHTKLLQLLTDCSL